MSIDIPRVQDSLKELVPSSVQQLINKVSNRLRSPRTAGSTSSYMSDLLQEAYYESSEENYNYTLGQDYYGDASLQVRGFGWSSMGRGIGDRNGRISGRRQLPNWLRGVKLCMVRGKEDHIANQYQSEEEMKEAVRKLKQNKYTSMLTEEGLLFLF